MADQECIHCHKGDGEASLRKCPVCFRYYCDEHAHLMGGRTFCSQPCAEFFFFSDDEE